MGVLTALCLGTAAVLWCTGQDWEATRFLYFSVFTLFIAGTLVYQRRSLSTAGPRGPGEAPDEAPGDTERR